MREGQLLELVQLQWSDAGPRRWGRTVLCHGVFDLLHPGHVAHLEAAKAMGDRLLVGITSDEHASKAPGRPIYSHEQRAAMVRALACVDEVRINHYPTCAPLLRDLKPALYVKGCDYRVEDLHIEERTAAAEVGAEIVFTSTPKMSSSAIINRYAESPELAEYLERARKLRFGERIPELIDRVSRLKVLFVGETIIDEYVYVTPLGKPSKEFIVAGEEVGREAFDGGVLAAAAHARSFVGTVEVTSGIQLTKRRFVDKDTTRKLFEVYADRRDLGDSPDMDAAEQYDVTVVTDFGHRMMGPLQRSIVRKYARYLAANAQTNAGNHGFNLVTNYATADYLCCDQPEAALACGVRDLDTPSMARKLRPSPAGSRGRIAITHGRNGCVVGWSTDETQRIPALTTKAVDTMGAGDAFLAVTASLMSVAKDDEVEIVGFVGNIVGALKCGIVGHREAVTKDAVLRTAATLLK